MPRKNKTTQEQQSAESSESDSTELNATMVEKGAPTSTPLRSVETNNLEEQLSAIFSGMSAIRKAVEDVRHETKKRLDDVCAQMDDKAVATNATVLAVPLSKTSSLTQPFLPQIEHTATTFSRGQSLCPVSNSFHEEMFPSNFARYQAQTPPYFSMPSVAQSQPYFHQYTTAPSAANVTPPSQLFTSSAMPAEPTGLLLPPPTSTLPSGHAMPCASEYNYRLYPLPTFDGKPEEWPLFFASYRDSSTEFRYNNKQNLMRLHKALYGDAKRAVTSLLIFPDDVPKVIEELQFNFGRPELLVRSQQVKIADIPAITESRLEAILSLSNQVRNMVALFKSAGCEHHLMNSSLLDMLVSKLPPSKQYEWARSAASFRPFPTVESFSIWVADLARVVSIMSNSAANTPRLNQPSPSQHRHQSSNANRQAELTTARRVFHSSEATPEHTKIVCAYCDEKWKQVKQNHLCFGCLKKGHSLATCRKKQICNTNGCNRQHNPLLHQDAAPGGSKFSLESAEHILNCRQISETTQLFKIIPVILFGPRGSLSVYAMLDEGSSISLIEEDVALELGLKGPTRSLTLQWYGDKKITEKSRQVAVNIKGKGTYTSFALKNICTVNKLNLPTQTLCVGKYPHMKSLPITSYTDAKPVVLLGLDNSYLGVYKDAVEAGPHQPIVAKTKLGWVAFGPISSKLKTVSTVLHVREAQMLSEVNAMVEEYFALENFGVRSTDLVLESDENRRARILLEATTKKQHNYFETGLLWRREDICFPQSYEMAKNRLLKVENKMARDVSYAESYKREVTKYIDKGYARLMLPEEANIEGSKNWYLPHFGVTNPNKPEKLRVVFDAAATIENVSLNSALLKGPEHAQPLFAILFKFRQGTIAVAGDIQEMFLQIKIRKADQNSQRFLWREGNTDMPIRTYVMTSMIFGAVCSPCCAEFIKNTNANEHRQAMPRGAAAVIDKTYVDDIVISFESEDDAEKVIEEAVKINANAAFHLRNFVSNCKTLEAKLNKSKPAYNNVLNMERQGKTDNVLGLYWNTDKDTLEFHFQFHKIPADVLESKRAPTKREMLGVIMAIYDPFGLLSNFTIFSKLLLQATWKLQVQWDEPLPYQLFLQWSNWWKEFHHIQDFSVARCYTPLLPSAEEVELHLFVDASSSAYAAVAYLRVKKKNQIDVALVAAKSRCAPPKGMTVPRLELQAAILGCRLKDSILQSHEFQPHRVIFWCDSKTVILWIRSTAREYKQFVACRIAEILSSTTPNQWHWLPTNLNVADEATRAKLPINFDRNSRWVCGPKFLHQDVDCWPQETSQMTSEQCSTEETTVRIMLLKENGKFLDNLSHSSSYLKILRCTAWGLRFIKNCRATPACRQMGELTAAELSKAENLVCNQVQEEAFSDEIKSLRHQGHVSKSSSIHQLTPYIDDDGVMRVKGRIDAAYCLPWTARRPIILPFSHRITRLVLDEIHRKRHHQNDQLVINEMRQKYWVPNSRTLLKSVKLRCPTCIAARAKPEVPLMGQLPPDRLTPYVRPFSYTGVDYCGPFYVAVGRRREKRWVALFTCLTTRAIHLEIADELSTDSFMICLRNFMNRRGTPVRIRSDNGTNFIGAQKELTKENRLFDFEAIQKTLVKDNIEWVFNCPANPSAGGCWERLVGCVKRLLSRTIKDETVRLETFRSALIEAENIVNSRPLTDLPLSTEDDEPLTPNHFLIGCLNSTQTPCIDEEKVCLRKQWRIAQNLKDRIWKRWIVEYLPQLIRRTKWTQEVTPLKPEQLVIMCDHNQPRSRWQKGIVTQVFTTKDGQVRTAEVRTPQGIFRRPVSKLAALKYVESSAS